MKRPLQIAHRGGAGLWPENTCDAFAKAIAAGADGIELDVHLTADNVLVVHHDERLNPAIVRGPDGAWVSEAAPLIKNLTLAELQRYDVGRLKPGATYSEHYPQQVPIDGARIPTLAQVFALVREKARSDFRIYVELKTALANLASSSSPAPLAAAAVALVRKSELDAQVTFVSFDWRALAHAKQLAPHIPNAFTTLPFFQVDPLDASAARDMPGSDEAQLRTQSAQGASWYAGFDWRDQEGADFSERVLKAIARAPANGWFAWHDDATARNVAQAHALGLSVACWTVNEISEMQSLALRNVDGLLTDRPDLLAQAFAR